MRLTVYEKAIGYSIGWAEVITDFIKSNYSEIAVCGAFPVTLVVSLLACAIVMNW